MVSKVNFTNKNKHPCLLSCVVSILNVIIRGPWRFWWCIIHDNVAFLKYLCYHAWWWPDESLNFFFFVHLCITLLIFISILIFIWDILCEEFSLFMVTLLWPAKLLYKYLLNKTVITCTASLHDRITIKFRFFVCFSLFSTLLLS